MVLINLRLIHCIRIYQKPFKERGACMTVLGCGVNGGGYSCLQKDQATLRQLKILEFSLYENISHQNFIFGMRIDCLFLHSLVSKIRNSNFHFVTRNNLKDFHLKLNHPFQMLTVSNRRIFRLNKE